MKLHRAVPLPFGVSIRTFITTEADTTGLPLLWVGAPMGGGAGMAVETRFGYFEVGADRRRLQSRLLAQLVADVHKRIGKDFAGFTIDPISDLRVNSVHLYAVDDYDRRFVFHYADNVATLRITYVSTGTVWFNSIRMFKDAVKSTQPLPKACDISAVFTLCQQGMELLESRAQKGTP